MDEGSSSLDQGSNPCPLRWKRGILTSGRKSTSLLSCLPPRKSLFSFVLFGNGKSTGLEHLV